MRINTNCFILNVRSNLFHGMGNKARQLATGGLFFLKMAHGGWIIKLCTRIKQVSHVIDVV